MVGKLPEPAVRSVLTRLQRAPSCAAESLIKEQCGHSLLEEPPEEMHTREEVLLHECEM